MRVRCCVTRRATSAGRAKRSSNLCRRPSNSPTSKGNRPQNARSKSQPPALTLADDRPTRHRQNDAGGAPRQSIAALERSRFARGRAHPFGARQFRSQTSEWRAPDSVAASHGVRRSVGRRRWANSEAWRNFARAPRHPVSRRTAGVRPTRARLAAAAARIRRHRTVPRTRARPLSGAVSVRCRDEPVPRGTPAAPRLRVHRRTATPLSESVIGTIVTASTSASSACADERGIVRRDRRWHQPATVRARIRAARDLQMKRAGKLNGLLTPRQIDQHCALDGVGARWSGVRWIDSVCRRAAYTASSNSRTLADLAGEPVIRTSDRRSRSAS